MALRLREAFVRAREELRYEPTEKRVRAMLGERAVADSAAAMLVWEPRRVLPSYAVPAEAVHAELAPSSAPPPDGDADAPLLHGGHPFGIHSTPGEVLDVRVDGDTREAAAFKPADPDLAGYVVLDFHAFDRWYEEDDPILAHPRDPFHRVDVLHSSRHVRVELDGELLAESTRPIIVFETGLPPRYYVPREDVRRELHPIEKRTYCAYKGEASYLSLDVGGEQRGDLVWSYEHPLDGATPIAGRVSFFNEKVDIVVDGRRREEPQSALAATIVEEAGV
jgi:uncharacterized protein (DUF427 family)